MKMMGGGGGFNNYNNYEAEEEEEEEEGQVVGKKANTLPVWGNEKTMNLNTLVLTNIQSSQYFKVKLYALKTYHEVLDEIYYQVSHLEPWEKGSRKTAGQTGMCGGVRGVGAGGIVSTAFCILYKLFTLRLTRKQLMGLINNADSPYIRGLGFMYIRYTQPPPDLWDWMEPYLDDEEELDVRAGGGQTITIGTLARQLLTKLEWHATLFPRIPVPIQKDIEKKISEWDNQYQEQAVKERLQGGNGWGQGGRAEGVQAAASNGCAVSRDRGRDSKEQLASWDRNGRTSRTSRDRTSKDRYSRDRTSRVRERSKEHQDTARDRGGRDRHASRDRGSLADDRRDRHASKDHGDGARRNKSRERYDGHTRDRRSRDREELRKGHREDYRRSRDRDYRRSRDRDYRRSRDKDYRRSRDREVRRSRDKEDRRSREREDRHKHKRDRKDREKDRSSKKHRSRSRSPHDYSDALQRETERIKSRPSHRSRSRSRDRKHRR